MKPGKSEVIIILDRSGSMTGIKTDMEGGFKDFLTKQKKEPGECLVSLYQFDDVYESVFEAKDIQTVDGIVLEPRNMTALYDAVGKTINSVGERLKNTPEAERPETVIVVVVTDGMNNASKEFDAARVKSMVEHQSTKYNWKFVFLGANQDAVFSGGTIGVAGGLSLSYAANSKGVGSTFSVLSSGVSCLRSAAAASYSFSDEERAKAMGVEDPVFPATTQWGFKLDANGKVVSLQPKDKV